MTRASWPGRPAWTRGGHCAECASKPMTPRSGHPMPDESPADLFQPVGTAHDLSNDGPEPGQAVAMRPWSKQIIGLAVATLGVVGATVAYALIAPPSDRA